VPTYNRSPVSTSKVKDIFSSLKGNARAMEILMDELTLSDVHTDGTRRFMNATQLPSSSISMARGATPVSVNDALPALRAP
jgi:hypothetical protein